MMQTSTSSSSSGGLVYRALKKEKDDSTSISRRDEQQLEIIDKYITLMNQRDMAQYLTLFAQNAQANINGKKFEGIQGVEEVHRMFGFNKLAPQEGFFSAPSIYVNRIHFGNNSVVVEGGWSGTQQKTYCGIEPNGGKFQTDGVMIFTFNGQNQIMTDSCTWDDLNLTRQLQGKETTM